MSLSVGIVGLPNVGKSTLFNALLKRQIAQVAEYPYTTIEPNVGVVEVPDERLTLIAKRLTFSKVVPAAIRFIDIAGLIRGAHQGEGLGNQFLAHIREVDAILHVVRAFENPKVTHVNSKSDLKEDVGIVNLELEMAEIRKPVIYVLNVDEKSVADKSITSIKGITGLEQDAVVIPICAKLEAELSDLSDEDQRAYLSELGVDKSGLDQIIQESYKLLDLITFFTIAGGKSASTTHFAKSSSVENASARPRMAQAWPIKKGSKMIDAAEKVHTDFAKGFITAEVIKWDKLIDAGSWHMAKEKGLIHLAGRNEEIADGEVIEFKFKV